MKTIIFSELPNQEKKKYFNFLLENDINFSRDENGYYVALVKLLNPAFYGKSPENNSLYNISSGFEKNQKEEKTGFKPRSSSQKGRIINKLTNHRSKSPVSNGKFEKNVIKVILY